MVDYGYRTDYCTIHDVLRAFDPSLDADELAAPDNEYLGGDNTLEFVQTALEGAEADWEADTNTYFRPATYGTPGEYGTYHWLSKDDLINEESFSKPTRFYLRPNLIPFSGDDELLYRTSTDSFTPIDPSDRMINWATGEVELYDVLGRSYFKARTNRLFYRSPIVARYRYGAGGHRTGDAGETTTTESIASGDSNPSVGIADAARLPPDLRKPVLIGQSEYARIDVDRANDEITLTDRGVRGTEAKDHDSGATVHFCPLDVRKAVASKAAIELNDVDFFVEYVTERVEYSDVQSRIQRAQEYYDTKKAQYRQRGR